MQNAGLDEAQAGIKVAGRNINNIRYADDTTLMAESEELKTWIAAFEAPPSMGFSRQEYWSGVPLQSVNL